MKDRTVLTAAAFIAFVSCFCYAYCQDEKGKSLDYTNAENWRFEPNHDFPNAGTVTVVFDDGRVIKRGFYSLEDGGRSFLLICGFGSEDLLGDEGESFLKVVRNLMKSREMAERVEKARDEGAKKNGFVDPGLQE